MALVGTASAEVTIDQLSDVSPGDWAYTALEGLVNDYS